MNFLAPWFLLGALAVAGPVLFHLIRRSARERIPFSSLLLLRPTPPRATRRHRLEHIALLLLRCLAVLLLAACFARPFFSKANLSTPPTDQGRRMILLLDTSASMRRQGLWTKARDVAWQYLQKSSPLDRISIMTFDQQPRTLLSFADWSAWPSGQRAELAHARLDTVSPGWGGTHFGTALTSAAEMFSEEAAGPDANLQRDVVLISDMQEGAKLDGLQGHDWPNGVGFILEKVDPQKRGNAGLCIQNQTASSAGSGREARVRVVNARDSAGERFQMGWAAEGGNGFAGKSVDVYLPPGQSRVLAAPELPSGAATGALRLLGDDEDFDNTAYFAAAEPERIVIGYLASDSVDDPEHARYYLQRAFPETARRKVEVLSALSNSVVSAEVLNHAALFVVPSTPGAEELKTVRDWVSGGRTALLILTNADSGPTLAGLTGLNDVELAEVSDRYALLADVDFTHPIFAPFADPRFSDFSRIHFWKHRRWTLPANGGARVLAKFDDGAPALAQMGIGKGNLLVLCSGWIPADSQLALSTKFLPLLQTILDWSGGASPTRNQFLIGEAVQPPASPDWALEWHKPDGKTVAGAPDKPFADTDIPGIYTVTAGTKTLRFAVNLPPDESRTAPLSADDFARLGIPLRNNALFAEAKPAASQQRHVEESELEGRQKLWRWLIVALLTVAMVEIVLGGWLARRVKTLEVTA